VLENIQDVTVIDNFLSPDMLHEAYEFTQQVSYYGNVGAFSAEANNRHFNEYIPNFHGKRSMPHYVKENSTQEFANNILRNIGLCRHPLAVNHEVFTKQNTVANKIFNKINSDYFNNKATVDGIAEGMPSSSLIRKPFLNRQYVDNIKPYDKYDYIPENQTEYTVFINCRKFEPFRATESAFGRTLGPHRDSNTRVYDQNDLSYCTALFCANDFWHPEWGGEIIFHNDLENDDRFPHAKQNFNLGFVNRIVAHKPNRLIIFPHSSTHGLDRIKERAEECAFRYAFRIKIN
tara:strand:- start:74 stop:943 length:870 start_codon:yes stop_codon:yes gene_type:complete